MNVYANSNRLTLNSWNIGYGNKILHLYFLINYAHKNNLNPLIDCNSSLDDIFNLSSIKSLSVCPNLEIYREDAGYPQILFLEKVMYKLGLTFLSPYKIIDVYNNSKKSFLDELSFLHDCQYKNLEGYLSGHFWHYSLMPKIDVINQYISLRDDLVAIVKEKYESLFINEKHVAVHLRETDFRNHLNHIFKKSIALPDEYYIQSIEIFEKNLGRDLTYHLFSDNIDRIRNIFSGKKVVIHNDNATLSWVSMHLAKSIIQSNSSFCWSASLHNKVNSIQPKGGFNWFQSNIGSIPYGFEMPFSTIVDISNF